MLMSKTNIYQLQAVGAGRMHFSSSVSAILLPNGRGRSRGGRRGLESRSDFKLPNFLKIEIIEFCLTTSSHKSNFHANHAHHTHNAQNWNVEPLSDLRLDPPLYGFSSLAN